MLFPAAYALPVAPIPALQKKRKFVQLFFFFNTYLAWYIKKRCLRHFVVTCMHARLQNDAAAVSYSIM